MADSSEQDYQDYQDYLDYQEYSKTYATGSEGPSVLNEIAAVSNRFVEGAADLGGLVNEVNPFNPGGPRLFGLNSNLVNEAATAENLKNAARDDYFLGNEKAETPVGQVAGEVSYFLPSAIGGGLAPAVLAGAGSGVVKASGGDETDQAIGALVGALSPGAAKGLFGLAKMIPGVKTAGRAIDSGLNLFSPTRAARSELGAALNVDDVKGIIPSSELDKLQTVAEATQNPAAARLEQQVAKRTGAANDMLQANRTAKQAQAASTLEGLSDEPIYTKEMGGEKLRAVISPIAEEQKKAAETLFGGIDREAPIELNQALTNFIVSAKEVYQAGGMPGQLSSIVRDLSQLEPNKGGQIVRDFGYLHSLRQRASEAWLDLKTVGNDRGAKVANDLVRAIDGAAERSLPAEQVSKFKEARSAYSDFVKTFQSKGVGAATRQIGAGEYAINASKAVDRVFDGSPESARQLIKAIGETPENASTVQGLLRDKIKRETMNRDGIVSPSKFKNWLKTNGEALSAEFEGRSLLSKEQVERLKNLSDNLSFLDQQSPKAVKNMAYQASIGQPTTAQALIQEGVASNLMSKIPGINIIKEARQQAIDKILMGALLDPKKAEILLQKATPETLKYSATWLLPALSADYGFSEFSSSTLDIPQKKTQNKEVKADDVQARPVALFGRPNQRADFFLDDMAPKDFISDVTLDALRQVESGGGKYLKSKAGALGEYQFMPATAKEYGIDPMNPTQARNAARIYLQRSMQEFGGDLRLSLASYNAGVAGVKRAIRKAGSTNWDDVKQYLPSETQAYVPKIESWIRTFRKKAEEAPNISKPIKV